MSYTIKSEQEIPISLTEAWDFFSRPENLEQLTPSDIGFEILHNDSEVMHEGQIICYKIGILPFINVHWVTEITKVVENTRFVDDQRIGPYKLWHHTHEFEETENGVLMKDKVHYALPFGIFGKIAHLVFVRKKLQQIFEYRKHAVNNLFVNQAKV